MLHSTGFAICAVLCAANTGAPSAALTPEQMAAVLKNIDHRMSFPVDYTAKVYLEEKRPDQAERIFGLTILRRDKDDNMIILTTKPKTEAGKGMLRLEKNLWYYDPTTGKWDRQTERDRIAGTSARRRDFDDWDFAETFDPSYERQEKLGAFVAHKLKLVAKPSADVAYSLLYIWVDTKTGNPLKIESMSASGKLAQTTFYPKWIEAKVPGSPSTVFYPKEIRIKDELDGGSRTLILVQETDLRPLPENVFTKAWMETQSR